MELLQHPSEGNFRLPIRLYPQLRKMAEGHYRVSKIFQKLRRIFPGKIIGDERTFDEFIHYYHKLPELLPNTMPGKNEDEKTKSILYKVTGFSSHDIAHLAPYQWMGKANTFLRDPELHLPRIADALDNYTDCTEGVGAFLSPDEVALSEFDIEEVVARNFRKIQLRNQNYIFDPTSGFTVEMSNNRKERNKQEREKLLENGIDGLKKQDIYSLERRYKKGTSESIHDCIEFDFRKSETINAMIVEQGNRGIIFLIIYNIIKNGYKMIDGFTDYSMTIEALHRDLGQKGISESDKEFLMKEIMKLE